MTITLDSEWIADISMDRYDASDLPMGRYAKYLSIISDPTYGRLANDNLLNSDGSLKTGAEPFAALLICDLIQSGPVSDLGLMSENFGGDYSYQKSALVARDTKSAFLSKYEDLLSKRNTGVFASSGTVRNDYEIEFAKLSQGTPPRVGNSSDNYPTV